MQLALKFRNMLPTVVREELDSLVATISGFWDVEHKANGSHGDIHVDSITVGGIPIIPSAGGGGGGGGGSGGMEYLGDYRPGPAYVDGDIVVAPDGIAYVCVVDGTTTPPEPWPGGGVAVNATVDATYWVVSPHGSLTNERVMSTLSNGYVKATLGEPSTVAQIPIVDGGTGAGTPAAARTNLGVGSVGTLNLNGNAAQYLNGAGGWTTPPQSVGIQSGSIIFFTSPCPPGYTRVTALDGRFIRAGAAYAVGGAASHSHGPGTYAAPSHTHGVGTLVEAAHTHAVGTLASPAHSHGGGTLTVTAHSHSVPNTDTAGNHAHSFTAQTDVESNGSGVMDAGGNQNCTRAPHTHGVSGNTNTTGDHYHTMGNTGNANPGISGGATQGIAVTLTGATAANSGAISGATAASGGLAIAGASDAQANLPLYVDLFACEKD